MSKETKIVCPKCGAEINVLDVTKNQLKEREKELTFKEKLALWIWETL